MGYKGVISDQSSVIGHKGQALGQSERKSRGRVKVTTKADGNVMGRWVLDSGLGSLDCGI